MDEEPPRKIYKQPNLPDVWPAAQNLPAHEQRALAVFVDLFVGQAKRRGRWSPEDWDALRLIRLVFLVDWDPIGVFEHSGADDEYDDYVPSFYELLRSGAPQDQLVDYLHKIERETMGLSRCDAPQSVVRRQESVRKILSHHTHAPSGFSRWA